MTDLTGKMRSEWLSSNTIRRASGVKKRSNLTVSTLKYDASEMFLHKGKWQTVMKAGVNHFDFEKFLEAF